MIQQFLKSIFSHQGFRKYFANTTWLFSEKILRIFVGLFVGVWVARYLGPSQFGDFNYAISFAGLFMTIATLGLDGIVIRELVKDESKRDRLLGTSFVLKIIGALVTVVLIAISIQFTHNDNYGNLFIFIIASSTVFQSFNIIDFYFQSKVLSKYVVYANIISLLFSSILKITLILMDAPLIAFVLVVLFDSVVLALGLIYFYAKKHLNMLNWKFDKSLAKILLKDSWPLILSGVVISIYMKIDQIMIKEMLNAEAVGNYAAAVRISEAWYFVPMVISASLFPAIINAKNRDEIQYKKRLQNLYDFMTWMSLSIALPMTFLSVWLINMLFGKAYGEAGGVLMIHIWTGLFVALGVASGKWLINENLQRISLYRTSAGAVFNIIINFILIQKYQLIGAAISTLVAQIIAAYLFDLFNKKTRATFIMKTKSLLFISLFKKVYHYVR